jgi:hypothetical protein
MRRRRPAPEKGESGAAAFAVRDGRVLCPAAKKRKRRGDAQKISALRWTNMQKDA